MKEDILEQLVDDYLQHKGYFTRHNIKFRPWESHPDYASKHDSVHSDIDVIGLNPKLSGPERVWVVSCKSRQDGFRPVRTIRDMEEGRVRAGRKAWKLFRELTVPKWSDAFLRAVEEITREKEFVYITAVTKLIGDRSVWESHAPFRERIRGNQVRILTLADMLDDLYPDIKVTPASSDIGRFLQLMKASQWRPDGPELTSQSQGRRRFSRHVA